MTSTTSLHALAAPVAPPLAASLPSPTSRARRRSVGYWIVVAFAGLAILTTLGVASLILSFLPGSETRAVRQAILTASPKDWQPSFEFGVGRFPAFLARTGISLAGRYHDIPPELQAGLSAFQSADVSVFTRRSHFNASNDSDAMRLVDDAMTRRGWEPMVTVQDGREFVRVFLPTNLSSPRDLRACVLVMDDEHLVVASARVDAEPLVRMIEDLPTNGFHRRFRRPVFRE